MNARRTMNTVSVALALITARADSRAPRYPTTPVIMGGLSSSYYHEELIRYPQVDYVIRGDSAEEPLRQLLRAILDKRSLEDVPNLTWVDGDQVRVNELSHVPGDLDDISFDYRKIMRSVTRHGDLLGHLPFLNWLKGH